MLLPPIAISRCYSSECRLVCIALMVAAFVANTVFDVNVVVVILAAAVFGVVLALVQWKKGGAK